MLRSIFVTCLVALAASCASIGDFNRATAREDDVRLAAQSAVYGEGPRRSLDVYAPIGAHAEALPVIVFLYGGAWSSGDKADYRFAGEAFAAQGFVTIVPDYRVYPEVRFPGFVDDAAAALRWTQDHAGEYGGDPTRIVLVGHSAGAHIAMLTGLDAHYLSNAGVNPRAIRGIVGLAGPYGFNSFDMPLLRNVFGDVSDPLSVQPLHFVSANGPPLLLLHGDQDRRVPLRSLTHMEAAARAAGEPVESKIYARLDHPGILQALARRRADAPVLEDVAAFARRVTAR